MHNFVLLSFILQFVLNLFTNILVWQFVGKLLKDFGLINFRYSDPASKTIDEYDSLTIKWRYISMTALYFIVLPLNVQRSIANFRYISIIILVIVFSTITVSLVQSPFFYKAYRNNPDYELDLLYSPFEFKWLQGLATMMLSYNCQITFFYVRGEMIHKTKKRVRKVIRNLIFTEVVFYITIAMSGYLSLGSKMLPKIFTLRRKISKKILNI